MTEILDSAHKWKSNLVGATVWDTKTRKLMTNLLDLENQYYHNVLQTTYEYWSGGVQ